MLLDEPFSALDAQTKILLQRSFAQTIAASGVTTLLITHDLNEAVAMSDRILVMSKRPGRIVEEITVGLPDRDNPVARQSMPRTLELMRHLLHALHLDDRLMPDARTNGRGRRDNEDQPPRASRCHARAARAQEAVTYLLPAPPFLPAFAPHQLALKRGYYEGLNVTFQMGQGGANVATQVGTGNVPLGGAVGDTTMIVRANGVPVRAVTLLGGRSLFHIAARKAAGIGGIPALRGKRVGVIGFQDSGFYALLGVLAAHGMRRTDLQVQAVGPAGVMQLMIAGSLDAIVSVPEWTDAIQSANVEVDSFDMNEFFPAMAQVVMSSDSTIERRPEVVRGFVRGVLRAVQDCMDDLAAATRDYVAQVPQHPGKEAAIERIIRRYATEVYPSQPGIALGRFDAARMQTVQRFYLDNEIVRTAVPVDQLFTNAFAG